MLLDHDAAIRGIYEELALLRELLRGGLLPPRASLPASSAAALLMTSTRPFAMETTEKMLTRQVSVAVRLQAAARGFLARRRLQKVHKQMRDREAALAVVAFAFDAEGCDLDSLNGQLCRSADVSKGACGVFPVDGVLRLCGDGGRGGVFLLVASGDALPSASAFHLRLPRGRLCWSSSRPLLGGCAPMPLSFRWSPWDPGGRTHAISSCGWCLPSGSHTIKSRSLFQIKNNQISRDVKDLFLGHRFVWSRVIVKVPMLQLEDELLEKWRGNVRCRPAFPTPLQP
jgi:hypothetical protein